MSFQSNIAGIRHEKRKATATGEDLDDNGKAFLTELQANRLKAKAKR